MPRHDPSSKTQTENPANHLPQCLPSPDPFLLQDSLYQIGLHRSKGKDPAPPKKKHSIFREVTEPRSVRVEHQRTRLWKAPHPTVLLILPQNTLSSEGIQEPYRAGFRPAGSCWLPLSESSWNSLQLLSGGRPDSDRPDQRFRKVLSPFQNCEH